MYDRYTEHRGDRGRGFKMRKAMSGLVAMVFLLMPAMASAHAALLRLAGVVVAHDAAQAGYVIAEPRGQLDLVRTSRHLTLGSRIIVTGKRRADGSIVAKTIKIRAGRARVTRVRGVVVAHTRTTLTIADRGAVVTIRLRAHASRSLAARDGSHVMTTDDITAAGLSETSISDDGTGGNADLSGLVVSITAATATMPGAISLAVDDSTSLVVVHIPTGFDTTGLTPGREAELVASVTTDPTTNQPVFTLVSFHDQGQSHEHDGNGHSEAQISGVLAINPGGTITVASHDDTITFAVGGVDLSSFHSGDCVEAHGTIASDGTTTLTEITASSDCESGNHGGSADVETKGLVTINTDGTLTVGAQKFVIGTVDVSGIATGDCVQAHGLRDTAGTVTLTQIEKSDSCGSGGPGPESIKRTGPLTIGTTTITVEGLSFLIGSVDISAFHNGDCVHATGTQNADTTVSLTRIEPSGDCEH